MKSNERILIHAKIHSYCQSADKQGERQNESYPPLASLDPPVGRVKSLSLRESRHERPERGCITLVVFSLPFAQRLRSIAIASLFACAVCFAGCQQMGFRARDEELTRMMAEEDDWALPQSTNSRVPRPNVNDFKTQARREKTISPLGDLSSSSRDRNSTKRQNSVVDYGTNNDGPDSNDRYLSSVLSSPNQEIDIEGALASLPTAYRDILLNQLVAVQRQARAADRETRTLSDGNSQRTDIGKSDPQQSLAKDVGASKVSIRMTDTGYSDSESVTTANATHSLANGATATTATTAIAMTPPAVDRSDLATKNTNNIVPASAVLPVVSSPVVSSPVSASIPSMPTPSGNSLPQTSPMSWRQSLNQAVEQLEKQVKEAPASDDNLRISQEVTLRMLYVSQRRLDDALRPIDKLSNSEKDYFHHQMLALYEASNPDAMPVRSRHWSLVMNSQREATSHLAAVSNLEVKSVAFCTEVERYGVITKFPKYQFQADQELLLYCEIENVAANKVKEGYESQLQGSYEIIDSQGRKVADQLLPMEPEICQNHRRDYFIVYKIYMPQQIVAGNYQLRLTVEDMKARKFGQNQLDFQVRK